jgi:hypothetical protein
MFKIKKINHLWRLALIILMGSSTYATEHPLMDLGFTERQIEDLLIVCKDSEFECRIFTRQRQDKTDVVTLVGEFHRLKLGSYERGTRLLAHYPMVGLEPYEVRRARDISIISMLFYKMIYGIGMCSNFMPQKDTLFKYENRNQVILNLEVGVTDYLKFGHLRNNILASMGGIIMNYSLVDEYIETFFGLPPGTLVGSLLTVILLDNLYNRFLQYDPSSGPLKRERDQAIANNIVSGLEKNQYNEMAAVMGIAHLYGVGKRLKEKNFIDQSAAIDAEDQLSNRSTRIQDPQDETFASAIFRARVINDFAKENYPEDF